MEWRLHWLEAEGDLRPWREAIQSEIEVAHRAIERLIRPPRLDILVMRLAGAVIPEIGMVGHAYRKALFGLTLDPDNPRFEPSLRAGALQRQVAHEVHHCLRMAGPGYGQTLGEALVSEGLAGQFTAHLFGNPPEPWEDAVDEVTLRAHIPEDGALGAAPYDHAGWFFGSGGRRPRWLGYTLGYRMVADWLRMAPSPSGQAWVEIPAGEVIAAARGGVLRAERR